ncbi:hypothetical protein N9N67_05940, partial [Bacteriovoracaceae bacterium]|nr:hypothetical protein [Bacteriovoracaceae bacterium]
MIINCPDCGNKNYHKCGSFFRKNDSRVVQKYRCKECGKYYSNATFSDCYRQKKRRVNDLVYKLLCSGNSLRRIAFIVNVDRKTINRKLIFLGLRARRKNLLFLHKLRPVKHLQFDDLITKEHTKLKPLSVSIAVDTKTRYILGAKVSQIPAFGHLSKLSRKKYGRRKSFHKQGLDKLFSEITQLVQPEALIRSDKHKFYPDFVKRYFPKAKHQTFKGRKAAVAGQGELKKQARDPLFMINHTFAMFRDNIK